MICPKCKTEYREGFYRCADCDVALVEEGATADENSTDETSIDLLPALETKDSSFLSDIVALIEERNIPYLLQSGTALGLDSTSNTQNLEWRAVLYAFQDSLETVESIVAKVKEDRRNPSNTESNDEE